MNRCATLSRRSLLTGALAGASVLKPFGLANAAVQGRPSKLLLVFHPNGLEPGWQPTGKDGNFVLAPVMSALLPWKSQLLIVNGLQGGIRNEVQGHAQGMTSMWTGSQIAADSDLARHLSFDQIAASRLGAGSPFNSLELGVQSQPNGRVDNSNVMIYAGNANPLPAEDDPNRVFARLFGTAAVDPLDLERKKRQRGSVLDLVKAQLAEIRGHYGTEDRRLVDAHADNVRALEQRIDQLATLKCSGMYTPHKRAGDAPSRNTTFFTEMAGLQTDLLATAMGCGLTRVASLQYSTSVSDARIAGVNDQVAIHATMHTQPKEAKVRINRYFVEQLAALLGKLAAQKRPDGTTLLDETLVVWGSEMALGNHLNTPIPFIVAGGGGALKQGHYADFTDRPRHTRLLVTVLKALGIDDVEALGDLRGGNDQGAFDGLRG